MEGREKSATVGERRENPGKGRAGGGSSQASLSGILDDWVPCTPFSDHLFFLPCAPPPSTSHFKSIPTDFSTHAYISPSGQRTLCHQSETLETIILVNPTADSISSEVRPVPAPRLF
jgi:hypothetical protein